MQRGGSLPSSGFNLLKPMRAIISVRFVSCLFALALVATADTPVTSGAPLAEGNRAEAKKLAADLKFLNGQRAAMDEKRRALEAELTEVRQTGDTARAAELPPVIEMMRRKVESVDRQILAVNDRSKALPASEVPASGNKVGSTQPARKKSTVTAQAPRPVSAMAQEKIQVAARKLALNPNPSMAATRNAAHEMITANPVDFSGMPIEDAVMLMFLIVAQDARSDLKDLLVEMDAKRSGAQPQRDTTKKKTGAKPQTENDDISEADQRKITVLQARKAKIEQLLSEVTKKRADTSGQILENTK